MDKNYTPPVAAAPREERYSPISGWGLRGTTAAHEAREAEKRAKEGARAARTAAGEALATVTPANQGLVPDVTAAAETAAAKAIEAAEAAEAAARKARRAAQGAMSNRVQARSDAVNRSTNEARGAANRLARAADTAAKEAKEAATNVRDAVAHAATLANADLHTTPSDLLDHPSYDGSEFVGLNCKTYVNRDAVSRNCRMPPCFNERDYTAETLQDKIASGELGGSYAGEHLFGKTDGGDSGKEEAARIKSQYKRAFNICDDTLTYIPVSERQNGYIRPLTRLQRTCVNFLNDHDRKDSTWDLPTMVAFCGERLHYLTSVQRFHSSFVFRV